jgi:hypothetical protein
MRRACVVVGAAALAAAVLCCGGGGGGGAGVWITDKDPTVHKVSFDGESLLTVDDFV